MKIKQAAEIMRSLLQARIPYILVGRPGIGKTDVQEQLTTELDMDMVASHLATADPTDMKGIPWPDKSNGHADFLPIGEVATVLKATKPTLWFWDDFGQAPPAVQAAAMPWMLARRNGGHVLPDCVTIGLATNRRQDRAGVSGILSPVVSRTVVLDIEPDLDSFKEWGYQNGLDPHIIAFLANCNSLPGKDAQGNPIDMLCPEVTTASIENHPSPRTWKRASDILALGLNKQLQRLALTGCIGEAAAITLTAWLESYSSMVSVESILLDPHGSPLPKTLSERFAVCIGLASKANTKVYPRIITYVERLLAEGHGEFSALCIIDCIKRLPMLTNTIEHVRMMSGPMGQLILGDYED